MISHEDAKHHAAPMVVLLTDFGLQDGYVGIMKAVMLSICPQALLVDLTHDIEPQNVHQAAYVLLNAWRYLPKGAIVLAVVDPGVGSSRKPIAVQTDHCTLVGPDNGLFSYVLQHSEMQKAVALQNSQYQLPEVSATFHGRDIFSPAAAYLAKGVDIEQLGPPLSRLERLRQPNLRIETNAIHGELIYIDRFGNLISSIGDLTWDSNDMLRLNPAFDPIYEEGMNGLPPFQAEACAVEVGGQCFEPLYLSYVAVPKGKAVPLINSGNKLEIALNQGSAAELLGIKIGEPVTLRIGDEEGREAD